MDALTPRSKKTQDELRCPKCGGLHAWLPKGQPCPGQCPHGYPQTVRCHRCGE